MEGKASGLTGWFSELRRRHVFKVAAAYLVLAWLLMQVAAVLETSLKLPDWTDKLTFVFLAIGFPVALLLTWASDLTPKSEPDKSSDRTANTASAAISNPELVVQAQAKIIDVERPSIAVLPLENISGDPAQDFIGEGLAADIITGLSRISTFFVIARNSTFQYRGKSPDVRQVAKDLNVLFVVEGTAQRLGDRIRVSVQLIDGRSGHHLWAERYNRQFQDLFELQDELTAAIVGHLGAELTRAEYQRIKTKPAEDLNAWELYHKGLHFLTKLTAADQLEARRLFDRAIEHDANFAQPYAGQGLSQFMDGLFGITGEGSFPEATRLAQQAIKLEDRDAFSHAVLAFSFHGQRDYDKAFAEAQRALALNPSSADAHHALATSLLHKGKAEECLPYIVSGKATPSGVVCD